MRIMNEGEFIRRKTSNTIVVLGSGFSINAISQDDWSILAQYNTIGFNWFCKHFFEPTFYIIREQSNIKSRTHKNETVDIFLNRMNRYQKTCGIILDVSSHTGHAYPYKKDNRIKLDCIILRDNNKIRNDKQVFRSLDKDPFEKQGVVHGACTLISVMHIVRFLKYEKIVFAGVDLNDSRYFWLRKDQTRYTIKNKKLNFQSSHPVKDEVMHFMKRYKQRFNPRMFCLNGKSYLARLMPSIACREIKNV